MRRDKEAHGLWTLSEEDMCVHRCKPVFGDSVHPFFQGPQWSFSSGGHAEQGGLGA